MGFPHSSVGKEFACNAGDPSSIPGSGKFTSEGIGYPLQCSWAPLVVQLVKNLSSTWDRRPGFDSWVAKIPWKRERLPIPVFWPGEFHGLHSPWGHKELDPAEVWVNHVSKDNSSECGLSPASNPGNGRPQHFILHLLLKH